jgi:hypothetical protein
VIEVYFGLSSLVVAIPPMTPDTEEKIVKLKGECSSSCFTATIHHRGDSRLTDMFIGDYVDLGYSAGQLPNISSVVL